ncbi:unnamed protein product [Hydatigera taeniaeformis]|uniref:Fibronectin type-III domain-containing protein n=1 Tax=Hydatigena taeniaeformis TaxID=6205 RepID=A0A0R3XD76_HYDTA|nr:unnamed protein product [Hydatigera taeniaeformis]
MRKPTFEAAYSGYDQDMLLSIHNPKEVRGQFGGFEVFMESGDSGAQVSWRSVANLTATERQYTIRDLKPLTTYLVTVRGLELSYGFSVLADPVNVTAFDPVQHNACPFPIHCQTH